MKDRKGCELYVACLQVFEQRLRVKELFLDFDKLRSGRLPQQTFRRAIGATKLCLQESELSILEDQSVPSLCIL